MDPKIRAIIDKMNAHRKTNHPWQRGVPVSQVYYSWSSKTETWTPMRGSDQHQPFSNSSFSVLSWNIDFMRSFTNERMTTALSYLKEYVTGLPYPCIVMFNEMLVSDLELIQDQSWVQVNYNLTDISHEFWESGYYGTCVLVPSTLPMTDVFRVHYEDTAMERDGLFIDLAIGGRTVRVCSTHLESLVAKPPKRPGQLATSAKLMRQADASILGGDLNAIEPFDKTLHSDNHLKDAYIEAGGVEDAQSGMTWGQMAATKERNMFGLSRMDKLMFWGALEVEHFETFGLDVVVEDEDVGKRMMQEDGLEKPWVTDHLGVRGDFRVISGSAPAEHSKI